MSSCELRGQFERREVAERLRCSAEHSWDAGVFDQGVLLILGVGMGEEDGFSDTNDVRRLADLIDPTTTVDETGVETVADAVHLCECNECGHSFEWVYGEYEYCPRCGSRIVGGNEYEKASNPMPLEGGEPNEA